MIDTVDKKQLLEAAILIAGEPVTLDHLLNLFPEEAQVSSKELKTLLTELAASCETRGIELVQVASGYRFQAKPFLASWLQRLSHDKAPRYSRALLETLALIAYRQPITRGEIEEIRGVAVSSQIIRQLLEREWIKIVGYKEVPGKPALFGTTKSFLDYFSLKTLSDLPALQDIADLDRAEAVLGEQLSLEVTLPADSLPKEENSREKTLSEDVLLAEIDQLLESVGS